MLNNLLVKIYISITDKLDFEQFELNLTKDVVVSGISWITISSISGIVGNWVSPITGIDGWRTISGNNGGTMGVGNSNWRGYVLDNWSMVSVCLSGLLIKECNAFIK